MKNYYTFQEFIYLLCQYWTKHGCLWSQPYDMPMGAGTFHPHTFFKAIGKNPWSSVYVQPCRRPIDGRFGKSPNRLQHYYQLQVLLKPAPENIIDIYLKSLQHIGIELKKHDINLYEDNWKSPTLGAWGLGWEVRANGEEVTQFTYFQEFGGLPLEIVPCELTYGLERLYMYRYGHHNIMDIPFNDKYTYGDIFYQSENEFSQYNFKTADTKLLFSQFDLYESKVKELCEEKLSLPAYDYVLQASHTFNLLDSRGAISVTERQRYIGRIRDCAKSCALTYQETIKPVFPSEDHEKSVKISHSLKDTYSSKSKLKKTKNVEILLEIGVEELPPNFQKTALDDLNSKISLSLKQMGGQYSYNPDFIKKIENIKFEVNTSARRISILCTNVPILTPKHQIELWGPSENIAKDKEGNLTQAGLGFCKKQNINPKKAQFKQNPKSNVNFLYALKTIEEEDFPKLLLECFKNLIYQLDSNTKMHWLPSNIQEHKFVRPVRWILCLVDDKVFPLEMFGLKSSFHTYGQRVLSQNPILIEKVSEYRSKLLKSNVVVNNLERKNKILSQIQSILEKLGSHYLLSHNDALLEKCIGLTESPVVFLGEFKKSYLKLPNKLITSVLKEHMNYFSVWDANKNEIAPYYIGVASYKCTEQKSMILSTQKVVTSRLEDGAFYFEIDLKTPIQSLRESLKNQVFQNDLGTLYDKSERLSIFSKHIAKLVNLKELNFFSEEDFELLFEAGRHCKNDLKTGCVQEFPDEMQGVMGGVMVRAQNSFQYKYKSDSVASAIEEHYMPQNAFAGLPKTKYGKTLALADKFDSLVLLFSTGFEPKGTHDPFGLRRLAIAIARLLDIKNEDKSPFGCISVKELFETWQNSCGKNFSVNTQGVYKFFNDRIKSILKESFNTNSVEAISQNFINFPLSINVLLLSELENFLMSADCLNPYKRARSMLQGVGEGQVSTAYFNNESEKNLYAVLTEVEYNTQKFFSNYEFLLFFKELSLIQKPLSDFFDSVLVNDANLDIRQNRLQLLYRVKKVYERYIDFSIIQGFKE